MTSLNLCQFIGNVGKIESRYLSNGDQVVNLSLACNDHYKDKRITEDIGNRYSPRSYEEQEDGSVTITCEKSNDEMPFLGGYGVFGMSADNLEEAD